MIMIMISGIENVENDVKNVVMKTKELWKV